MSRIGKAIINIPAGVTVTQADRDVTVKGPKGTTTLTMDKSITIKSEGQTLTLSRSSEEKRIKSMHGLYRSLIANMVRGVTDGFIKDLEISGVGYRAAKEGKKLVLSMGYSHPVTVDPPHGIEFLVEGQTKVRVIGIDKHMVGQIAADIKKIRPVEPYKGKGIKYAGQYVRRKAGKAAAKAAA
ncbi:MAG: 50S ribosomal protein L6 [Candidatus Saganbacteria bacterium]|nr:50S ribosomal protein L6 [Candidatus Saganbacteria bacterium]